MTYRPRLEQPVLRQMPGLPDNAFDLLVRTRARICDDPYDRLFRMTRGKDPRDRMGELSDFGFIGQVSGHAAFLASMTMHGGTDASSVDQAAGSPGRG